MSTAIQQMQAARFISNQEAQNAAEADKDRAIGEQRGKIEEVRANRITEVEKKVDAMETSSFWTTLGTIVLGPVIGTLIGMGVGGLANNGDEDASRQAKTLAGAANIEKGKLEEDFTDATDKLEELRSDQEQTEKFSKELRTNSTDEAALV